MSPHLIPFSRWLIGRRLTSPPPPLDASALGATAPLLPAMRQLEPFVGEEREYTHFRSWEGDPELSAPACGIRWTCYSDESQRPHLGRGALRAGDGLRDLVVREPLHEY
jgi:hypothetical protein